MHTTNPEGEIMSIAWKYRIQNKIHKTNQEVHMMSVSILSQHVALETDEGSNPHLNVASPL